MHERERDGAGVRDIEALDRAGEIEAGQTIASLARQPSQALVLGAEDQGQRARNRFIRERVRRLRIEPDPPIAHVPHLGERPRQIGDAANRHVLEPAGSRFRQRAGEVGRVALGRDKRVDGEGGARPQDRADIVRVRDLVETSTRPFAGKSAISIGASGRASSNSP